jgi:hypothetical protein
VKRRSRARSPPASWEAGAARGERGLTGGEGIIYQKIVHPLPTGAQTQCRPRMTDQEADEIILSAVLRHHYGLISIP